MAGVVVGGWECYIWPLSPLWFGNFCFVCEVQFLLPSVGNSQTGLSRGEQRNRTVNRIIERHSLEAAISSIFSPAASTTLTPHFFCSKVDMVSMTTFGTLLFYLLIYFFPERETWEERWGCGLTACLLLLFVSPVLLTLCVSFLSTSWSSSSSPSIGPPCLVLSVSFCPHDHVLPLLHGLLSLPLFLSVPMITFFLCFMIFYLFPCSSLGSLVFRLTQSSSLSFILTQTSIYFYPSRWIKILWASL